MSKHPFRPKSIMQRKTGGRTYGYIRDDPDKPDHIICGYWENGPMEVSIPIAELQHYPHPTIGINMGSFSGKTGGD